MLCGHQYTEPVEEGEDKERSCPSCRSNSIRHLKKKPGNGKASASGPEGTPADG